METLADRPNRIPWPPLIYGAATIVALGLHFAAPTPWFVPPFSDILVAVGGVAIIAALAIDISAIRALRRGRTTIQPHRGADHLVTDGAFALSRHPLYLGNTLLMVGIALIFGIAWFLLLAILAAFATQKLAIEREEAHLALRFGKAYRDYAKRVRRWI